MKDAMEQPERGRRVERQDARAYEQVKRETFEKSMHEAEAAIDRSRNLRQAISLQRVWRALQRRGVKDS